LYINSANTGSCITNCSVTPSTPLFDVVSNRCLNSCIDSLVLVNINKCNLCTVGLFKNDTGNCASSCSTGEYPYDDNATNRICDKCHSDCKTCAGVYAENCTTCWTNSSSQFLFLSMCVLNTSCPDGTYPNNFTGSNPSCTQCPNNLTNPNLNCSTCVYSTVKSTVVCISCLYGYYYNSTTQLCGITCGAKFYPNNANNSCVACASSCAACSSSSSRSCTSCPAFQYYLINMTGGYCLNACPSVKYFNSSFKCLSCYSSCNSCNGSLISSNKYIYIQIVYLVLKICIYIQDIVISPVLQEPIKIILLMFVHHANLHALSVTVQKIATVQNATVHMYSIIQLVQ
jgi:hypothetical protein